uniref:CCHC-type domain-containing protein n=1 Tax=Tanacetum cinerariifolium TaxID=118510 RepID=A0A6L2MJ33_TANCI|nr:hypothetical protein [Tanacetum cinerariifolium]
MTTPNVTSSTDSQMHNNIMAAGLRDPLRKCILNGPYKPTTVLVQAVEATDDSPAIPKHTTVETPMNMSLENKAHFQAEKEAIHLILTRIGDEIYSTIDACQTAQEMWEAIKRLQQETMESYYTRFYKLMNEMIRNNLTVTMMQVNVQFLQQLQPQMVKISKECQVLLLKLIKTHSTKHQGLTNHATSSKPSIPTRSHTTTKHKGKEIAKPITPPSETASKEDSDPEQPQRDKDMKKNLALIAKYFKKIYKPTNNNLKTSSNPRNKNVDTAPRFKNDNQSKQFRNQRTVNVAGVRERVGSPVVQQSGIQCFNCKEYGHFAKECRKSKRVKDFAYHKEKMLLCKQAKQEAHYSYMAKIQEVPTADLGTDSGPLEQVHNNAGYNVFANDLQRSEQSESVSNTCLVETDDSNVVPDSPDMCEDAIQNEQNDVESDDERVALANLIANLKLDVDENKKIQKQLRKANTTLAQELKECKTILEETSKSLGESISVRDSCLVALRTKQAEFEKYKAFNDRTIDYDKLERKLNETLGQLALKDIKIKEGLKTKAYEILVVKQKHDELMKQSLLTKSHYEGLVKQKTKNDSFRFVHELKQEMHADLKYVESLEKEIDELESDKAEFSDMYDVILQECVSKDVICPYLQSLSDLDALDGLQCLYLHKQSSVIANLKFLGLTFDSIELYKHHKASVASCFLVDTGREGLPMTLSSG